MGTFWENIMLLGSVNHFRELRNIRRCCYAQERLQRKM
nr:MAG TPA: hypothetical protein [Caudoviricetes sp.]